MIALAYLFLCLVWSTTWQFIRVSLTGYSPLVAATLRFALGTGMLFLLCLASALRRGDHRRALGLRAGLLLPSARHHVLFALAGLLNGLGYACTYVAQKTLSAGLTAIICSSSPFFVLLLSWATRIETPRLDRGLGILLGVLGISVLFWEGASSGSAHLFAMLLVVATAALLWPVYSFILKRASLGLPPLLSTAYFLFYTSLTVAGIALLRGESIGALRAIPLSAHLAILYLAVVGSVLAWTTFLWLMQRVALSVLASIGLVQPVLIVVLDLFFKESRLDVRGLCGVLFVSIGMALTLRRPQAAGPSR